MAGIKAQHLRKEFAEFTAVQNSNFTVNEGEFFCLLGPSGCGKTTTLRMIAGLELPTSGTISLGNVDVTYKRASERDIAFVFQMFALYPHMNVQQNIAFPLICQNLPNSQIKQRVEEAAQILRITDLLKRSVNGLSSGDRQRVALGRAIVRKPEAFLMDEPLGALDAEFRELMCYELRQLHDRLKATTVYVTHDQREAMAMADKIAIMNNGVIEQIGVPQNIYLYPATSFVADFMGSPAMNLIPFVSSLQVGDSSVVIDSVRIKIPQIKNALSSRKMFFGIRPEHVQLDDHSSLRAEVLGIEYLGNFQIITLKLKNQSVIRAKINLTTKVSRGDFVGVSFEFKQVTLFDQSTGVAIPSVRDDWTVSQIFYKGVENF